MARSPARAFLGVPVGVLLSLAGLAIPAGADHFVRSALASPQAGALLRPTEEVRFERHVFKVAVAATPAARALGLGGVAPIPRDEGMLFVYRTAYRYGYWMKGMRFDLDIIWLDPSKRVVTVARDLVPASYPRIYYPTSPAQYVLELDAGVSASIGLRPGSRLVF